ncbi:hypothetical protein G6F20_014250 [Rhizopus arrhizus]|nr:hypothetical protein G6F20_014250 [Rhizopus arrhizus]
MLGERRDVAIHAFAEQRADFQIAPVGRGQHRDRGHLVTLSGDTVSGRNIVAARLVLNPSSARSVPEYFDDPIDGVDG